MEYYENISASMSSDSLFEKLVSASWSVANPSMAPPPPEQKALNGVGKLLPVRLNVLKCVVFVLF